MFDDFGMPTASNWWLSYKSVPNIRFLRVISTQNKLLLHPSTTQIKMERLHTVLWDYSDLNFKEFLCCQDTLVPGNLSLRAVIVRDFPKWHRSHVNKTFDWFSSTYLTFYFWNEYKKSLAHFTLYICVLWSSFIINLAVTEERVCEHRTASVIKVNQARKSFHSSILSQ